MSEFTIPYERLPEDFAGRLDCPPAAPVEPLPAATVVLLRAGRWGGTLNILLLRRTRSAGFVPGAYVFPGGRVDAEDAAPALLARVQGLSPERAAARLELPDGEPPAIAYYVAAVREAFEETGILIAVDTNGEPAPCAAGNPAVAQLRRALLAGERSFTEVLHGLDLRIAGHALEYIAHWITPEGEPRRYDTRFFAAAVPGDREVSLHRPELVDAVWCSPAEALERHRRGELPMIFPTLRTLESVARYGSPQEVLAAFRDVRIPTVRPRLVRGESGLSIEIPE